MWTYVWGIPYLLVCTYVCMQALLLLTQFFILKKIALVVTGTALAAALNSISIVPVTE